ncbi:hypothetical protein [Methanospirillum hungatei]|uniref:hypothetical protein n=1 Tax=Methanospirillum hungatei TaxID=2203 RepID=UPI0026F0AF0E|nr:hypothetical protein [Methanospirillum hungatei]MCA1915114.1 hypothetical protein [Methanospirillum hungatei]
MKSCVSDGIIGVIPEGYRVSIQKHYVVFRGCIIMPADVLVRGTVVEQHYSFFSLDPPPGGE